MIKITFSLFLFQYKNLNKILYHFFIREIKRTRCIIVGVGSCSADGFLRIGGYFRILIIFGISVFGALLVTFKKMKKRIT
ncbi:MAG: hypothetical protein ACFFC3_01485 [Candidatus Odinarchaeota archaeon]